MQVQRALVPSSVSLILSALLKLSYVSTHPHAGAHRPRERLCTPSREVAALLLLTVLGLVHPSIVRGAPRAV